MAAVTNGRRVFVRALMETEVARGHGGKLDLLYDNHLPWEELTGLLRSSLIFSESAAPPSNQHITLGFSFWSVSLWQTRLSRSQSLEQGMVFCREAERHR